MMRGDFHVHSNFSDGADPPEAVVRAALDRGMTRLGFSDHGYAAYDGDCCIPRARVSAYRETVAALRETYRGRIEIFCGVEQDLYSDAPTEGFDYVIGSVHYLYLGGEYHALDWKPEILRETCARFFGGDMYALTAAYYEAVAAVHARTGCDIIGHFDLISKFNERERLFDPADPRYITAWQAAAEALLPCGVPFEINTGAMSRGWRTAPYPAEDIMRYLAARGARFVLSSDSHSAETLCYDFEAQTRRAAALGLELTAFERRLLE
ncbi:MAG: histidinol-phosphatase HisJ family protein [Oscillospiraceae bacterium]|nr:histidinol-phosphatase HisJ family protein [Oscillospiraceae bacterium]